MSEMKHKVILPIICTVIFLPFLLINTASANPVPDTGQTKCYNNNYEIFCPQEGEPFYGQDAQYQINPQSYTKLDESGNELPDDAPWSWAMVRDNVTGLIWEVKTDDASIHDKWNAYSWYDAKSAFLTTLNSQNFGRHNDWRLPTLKELTLIFNRGAYSSINRTYFPNTDSVFGYWSSDSEVYSPRYAWYVGGGPNVDRKLSSWYGVLAVRGKQSESYGKLIDNGEASNNQDD